MSARKREKGQLRKRCCDVQGACDCDPRKYLIRVYLGRINGKRKYISRTLKDVSKKEAEKALRKWLRDLDTGTFIEPSEEFLIEFLRKEFVPAKAAEVSDTTLQNYKIRIKKQIEPELGHFRLSQLSRGRIQTWINDLKEEYAPSTVQQCHSVLKMALDLAVRDGLLPGNPARQVSLPARKPTKVEPLTRKEQERVLKELESTRYYAFWHLLFSTGMRPQEALALQWQDVDFKARRVSINKALKRNQTVGPTKTPASRRTVTVPQEALGVLREHRKDQIKEQFQRGPEWNTEGFVFATVNGNPPNHSNLGSTWKRSLEKAGVPHRRIYDIRHTHATRLMSKGVNPKLVQDRLGHGSVEITLNTYSHVQPEDRDAVANLLDQMDQEAREEEKFVDPLEAEWIA